MDLTIPDILHFRAVCVKHLYFSFKKLKFGDGVSSTVGLGF